MPDDKIHSLRSSHREALLEHLFAGEIMRRLGCRGEWRLEVLKPQVDDGGYSLVLEANGIVRHIQMKASFTGSTVRETKVNALLASKPSGCIIFIWFDKARPESRPLRVLRRAAGQAAAGHHRHENRTPHEGQRQRRQGGATDDTQNSPLSRFERIADLDALVARLFSSSA